MADSVGQRRVGPYLPYELIVSPDTAPGGLVDVYALAKTLWVLAAPLPSAPFGHQPADGSEYTLERMLSDPLRTEIDRLIDRATRTGPLQRPSMASSTMSCGPGSRPGSYRRRRPCQPGRGSA